MDEKINLSNYTISVRIGNNIQFINLDVFAALCDKFLFEDIVDIVTQSPTDKLVYSGVRNKVKFLLQIFPNES